MNFLARKIKISDFLTGRRIGKALKFCMESCLKAQLGAAVKK
jgi:hypothetical protein